MKFYFYFFCFVFHILPCLGAEEDNYDDYPEDFHYSSSYLTPPYIEEKSSSDMATRNMKLIKSDFDKFTRTKFFCHYNQPEKLIDSQQIVVVENMISTEICAILWSIKNRLDKMDLETQIFKGTDFAEIINSSLVKILELTPLLLSPFKEGETTSDQSDSTDFSPRERVAMKLNILLDRFFRNQLLAFSYSMLIPISNQNIKRYNQSGSAIRLKSHDLIEKEPKFDDLSSWRRKKNIFTSMDQAVRHLSNPLTPTAISDLKLGSIQYEITQEHLLDFYQESCVFLLSTYSQQLAESKTRPELLSHSLTYIDELFGLYNDYSKTFPELFKCKDREKGLLTNLYHPLLKIYDFHMQISAQNFRGEALKCTSLDQLSEILKAYIIDALKFNSKFLLNYEQLYKSNISDKFKDAIFNHLDTTLYILEHHFEPQRFTITKTLASVGWRQSQTKDFLLKLEQQYKPPFSFLYEETNPIGKTFTDKIKFLNEKIEKAEKESLTQTMETFETVKGYLNLSNWWNKDSKKFS